MYLEKYCVMHISVILIYFVNHWMHEIFEEVTKKRGLRSYNFSRQSYFVTLHASLQTVVIISSGGEFELICLGRYGPRCVLRVVVVVVVFFFRWLLGFLVCYIVRQQSQSVLCGSVLTTMAPKTENITVKTTNTLF